MEVVNLATGETRTYDRSLHPAEAVMTAFLQDTNDFSPGTYKDRMANMLNECVFGRKTVCYGDWSTMLTTTTTTTTTSTIGG